MELVVIWRGKLMGGHNKNTMRTGGTLSK